MIKPGNFLDPENKDEETSKLTEGIVARAFPRDFIGIDYEGDITKIPKGQEVSMYRELEGVFVMIDGERLFFNNPAYAKFIFYCAKAGLTEVKVPDAKQAKKAVKGLEQEINNVIYELDRRLGELNLPEEEKKKKLENALKTLGIGYYSDIVSKEELW